jgi:5'-methylthioadenosine phosphorylase
MDLKNYIREIPDWPKPGVNFKDITTLMENGDVFKYVIDQLCAPYKDEKIDKVVGIDARGFLLASTMAYKLNAGLSVVRKKGKLPYKTKSADYDLEYGSNTIEMHEDTIKPGEKVVVVDDLVATGGTLLATCKLVEEMGGKIVGVSYVVDLPFLGGINKLKEKYQTNYLVKYENEWEEKKEEIKSGDNIPLAEIGVFGGSGFYDLMTEKIEIDLPTPYGPTSDKISIGRIGNKNVAFIARHGQGHKFPPHKIPYKANLWAMKKLGVKKIISPAAVGSLQSHIKPGDFVICDQFINWTRNRGVDLRDDTFFHGANAAKGDLEKVAHISTADPYCPELRKFGAEACQKLNIPFHLNGTMVIIEGPRFSTRAESEFFGAQGWDIINMTAYPEVVLARELGMCYLNIGLVTDYDAGLSGHPEVEAVNMQDVLKVFKENNEKAKSLVFEIIKNLPSERNCRCEKFVEEAGV